MTDGANVRMLCNVQEPPPEGIPAVDTFCLMVLDPEEVDHQKLRGNIRHEHRSTVNAQGQREWQQQEVNP